MKKLKSAFCWQVTGLIQRMSKNYSEAAKSFQQALRFEPQNIQILRDVSNMCLHSRELKQHKEMRRKFLISKSTILANYSGFAIACHLVGDRAEAIEAIDSLLELANSDNSTERIDYTNIFIYKALLLRETERWKELLEMIEKNEGKILSTTFKWEQQALALIKLGQHQKAQEFVDKLIELRPDNESYIDLCVAARPGSDRVNVINDLRKLHKTRFLDFLLLRETKDLTVFKETLALEIDHNARRFVPSFFKSLREVCRDDGKRNAVLEVLTGALENYKKEGRLFPILNGKETHPNDPTAELFVLYSLAGFHSFAKDFKQAAKYVRLAIEHTPTFEDAQVLESQILKKNGNFDAAADKAVKWVHLVYSDKGLNSQAVRLLLKANKNQEGDALFKRFIREDKLAEKHIHELQMMNYELAMATSYAQEFKWPYALALLQIVEKNEQELFEDQFDFYSFCLRKYTLVPLYETLKFNDVGFKASKVGMRASSKFYKALALTQDWRVVEQATLDGKKAELGEEKFAEWTKERELQLKANTIETNDELRKEIDLDGANFIKTVDFDKKRAAIAAKLTVVEQSNVKSALKAKVYQMLFWHAIHIKDVAKAIDTFAKAVAGEKQSYDIELFPVKLARLLKEDTKSDDKQRATYEKTIAELSQKIISPHKNDQDHAQLISLLADSIKLGHTVTEKSAAVAGFLDAQLSAGFAQAPFPKKRALLKLAKDHCHHRDVLLRALKAKRENPLPA